MNANKSENEKVMETNAYKLEKAMGKWVKDRCQKRAQDHQKPMSLHPDVVKWLEEGGNSPPGKDENAPRAVLGWLFKTLENPAWAE